MPTLDLETALSRMDHYIGRTGPAKLEKMKGTSLYTLLIWLIPIRDYVVTLRRQQLQSMATEFAWLIQRNSAECSPLWWDGRYMAGDPNKAIRFSRREDAERVIEAQGLQLVHASEHGWFNPTDAAAELTPSQARPQEREIAIEMANPED